MTSSQLTAEEVKSIKKKAHMYVEKTSTYRNWTPIVPIQDGLKHEWYIQTRVPRGAASVDGRDYKDVQTAYTKADADLQSWRHGFSFSRLDVDMARAAGRDIWSDNLAATLKHLDLQIAHLILEGSNASFDVVDINGLRDGGTDIGGTTDGDAWGTVTKPWTNASECWQAMLTAGFEGPYNWVVSSNVIQYLKKKYGAGDPSEWSIIESDFDVTIYSETIGTTTELITYPIAPASADEGVFFWIKSDPSVFYLAEAIPVKVTINPTLNVRTNSYEGYVEWRGTVAIVEATGIQYTNSINIA